MSSNLLPSDRVAILGVIDPDILIAFQFFTVWIDAGQWHTLLGVLAVGDLAAGGNVSAKFQQATDSSGTGVKDVAGKETAPLEQGTNDDQQALINLRSEELDVLNGFRWVRLSVTVAATPNSATTALVLGTGPRYLPASEFDVASVAEIIA